MNLSDKLNSIAQGNTYYASALYDAIHHPIVTRNDTQVICRYLYGAELLSDRIRLQEISNNIEQYDNPVKGMA